MMSRYARLFKLDNPIAHMGCGPGMYSADALGLYKLDVDVFGIPAAFLHGLLGYRYMNDSLVLVDFVNQKVASGTDKLVAVVEAGQARFRAVILTSLTTFLGLLPIQLETSIQAQFIIPMAVSVGFGILFATTITLILVPSIYLILEDLRGLFVRRQLRP